MTIELSGEAYGLVAIALILAIFFLGGVVKGAAAFGLPLVTVPLLAFIVPLPTAFALGSVPQVFANIFQGWQNREGAVVIRRLWPLLVTLVVFMSLTLQLLTEVEPALIYIGIGLSIEIFVLLQFSGIQVIDGSRLGPTGFASVGAVAGAIGGLTSYFAFPALQLIASLRLERAAFAFAAAALFVTGSAVLGLGLTALGVMGEGELWLATLCTVPVVLGMTAGRAMISRFSREGFQRVVLGVMAVLGVSLIAKAFG